MAAEVRLRPVKDAERRCSARHPSNRLRCEMPDAHRGEHAAINLWSQRPVRWRNRRRTG